MLAVPGIDMANHSSSPTAQVAVQHSPQAVQVKLGCFDRCDNSEVTGRGIMGLCMQTSQGPAAQTDFRNLATEVCPTSAQVRFSPSRASHAFEMQG